MLRYRVMGADGRRVENTLPVGLVRDFPKEKDAWREVDKLGLLVRINDAPGPGRVRFDFLAEQYLKNDFGADAVRPKSANTIPIVEHYVRDYLIKRFGEAIAEDVKPLEIQKWLKSLNETKGLAWTTISKIRGLMHRIYKIGILHEHVAKNPVLHVETRCKSNYRAIIITPAQTLTILKSLSSPLHFALVLTCAATALRSSEILALRWADVLWIEGRIRVSKRWAKGEDGKTKTDASDGYVPLHSVLAEHLREWQRQTPYAKEADFVFPSMRSQGRKPLMFFRIRRRPSATGSKASRSAHRGRPAVRASQPASQPQQLVGEQGEGRTEDRARHPASQQDPDDSRSVHAGRLGRDTRSAGIVPECNGNALKFGAIECGLDCGLSLWVPSFRKLFGMYGGDDGARTRDLCRDRAAL